MVYYLNKNQMPTKSSSRISANMPSPIYNSDFYANMDSGSIRSAREVLKIVRDALNPKSVVDVGCGTGAWLKAWLELGVENILGIDGDYVRPEQLLIPVDRFRAMDLSTPAKLESQFDLVQSLEVGEHLHKDAADAFVSLLCSLGTVVLFSAAVPYQRGTHHVNEQWPEYWEKLFLKRNYIAVDFIRDRVWENPRVEPCYCQNTLFYVHADNAEVFEKLRGLPTDSEHKPLARIHPAIWQSRNEGPIVPETGLLRSTLKMLRRLRRKFLM